MVDDGTVDQQSLYSAIRNKDINTVRMLLKDNRVDPSEDDMYSVQVAVVEGEPTILHLLITDRRVTMTDSLVQWAIWDATETDNTEIVKVLLAYYLENDRKLSNVYLRNTIRLAEDGIARLLQDVMHRWWN